MTLVCIKMHELKFTKSNIVHFNASNPDHQETP